MAEIGKYNPRRYYTEFGSWDESLDAAGFDVTAVLLETIRNEVTNSDGLPTQSQVIDRSPYPNNWYHNRLGSWKDALDAAGIELPSEEEIVAELEQLDRELLGVPTANDFTKQTQYNRTEYQHHFDSWDDVLAAAGVVTTGADVVGEDRKPTRDISGHPSRQEVIESIQWLDRDRSGRPSSGDLATCEGYQRKDYKHHFDSWDDALVAAGVVPSKSDVIEEIRALNRNRSGRPSSGDLAAREGYRREDYKRYFDSWKEALAAAETLFTEENVVEENREPTHDLSAHPPKEEVIEAIRWLDLDLTHTPTRSDFVAREAYRRKDYLVHFDSWGDALTAAGALPSKQDVIEAIQELSSEQPRLLKDSTHSGGGDGDHTYYSQYFDSWREAVMTALPKAEGEQEALRTIIGQPRLDWINNLAIEMGRPPSKVYVQTNSEIDVDSISEFVPDWDTVLIAADLDPSRVDPVKDCAYEIEQLASVLEHRPSEEEVKEYVIRKTRHVVWRHLSIREALVEADIPAQRDLTPSRSLTRQRSDRSESEIPSHTDLLVELNLLRSRNGRKDLEQTFEERGVISERHYDVQFGGVSEAIDQLESLDARSFREPVDHGRAVPAVMLEESVEELAEILERRPLLEEVIFLGDAKPVDFVDSFDSWEAVSDGVLPIECWTNEELFDNLERVGRNLSKPPTLWEMADIGTLPPQCYLRRFGSWPRTLALVGVDVGHAPDEYLGFKETERLWEVTDYLLQERFGYKHALFDELHRLAFEFGRTPSTAEVRSYSPYSVELYRDAFGSVASGVSAAGIEAGSNDGHSPGPTAEDLLGELHQVSERSTKWILPQEICLEARYSPGTFLGTFGSLEEALERANYPTKHLVGPTDTYCHVWDSDHQVKTGLLRRIQSIASKTGESPTMAQLMSVEDIPQNIIYKYFDGWDDALVAAEINTDIGSMAKAENKYEGVENPDFVDNLLSEISGMMNDT